jgi:hypothetical protein
MPLLHFPHTAHNISSSFRSRLKGTTNLKCPGPLQWVVNVKYSGQFLASFFPESKSSSYPSLQVTRLKIVQLYSCRQFLLPRHRKSCPNPRKRKYNENTIAIRYCSRRVGRYRRNIPVCESTRFSQGDCHKSKLVKIQLSFPFAKNVFDRQLRRPGRWMISTLCRKGLGMRLHLNRRELDFSFNPHVDLRGWCK